MIRITVWMLLFCSLDCSANLLAQAEDLATRVKAVQSRLETLRGVKFRNDVKVATQSQKEFGDYLDRMFDMQVPEHLQANYGKIVKALGLYRGPDIANVRSLVKLVMQSQAAAYYDPDKGTFFVVMQQLPEQMRDAVYAHELYHGLQDQYHDLRGYLLHQTAAGLNDDELLARQAVVEGEATYAMTLLTMKSMFGAVPERPVLQLAIRMQSQMGVSQLLQMLKSGALPVSQNDELKNAVAKMDEIPAFMLETMIGAYLKGMGFVFEIQGHGWDKVDELYRRPPVSTEQILHPEKWLADERPETYHWPNLAENELLADWRLLETNTLGELQWRIVFSEQGLESRSVAAAAGWNGDTFAILEHKTSGKLLVLAYTSWDTSADAEEFADAYTEVLAIMHGGKPGFGKVLQKETDVLVVNGWESSPALLRDYLAILGEITKAPR